MYNNKLRANDFIDIAFYNTQATDGRIIKEEIIDEIITSFKELNYKPYLTLSHNNKRRNDRIGTIIELRKDKNSKTLQAKFSMLDEDILKEVDEGKYLYMSVELTRSVIRDKKMFQLKGVALLGNDQPAFDLDPLLSFSKFDEDNIIYNFKENNTMEELKDKVEETTTDVLAPAKRKRSKDTFEKKYEEAIASSTELKGKLDFAKTENQVLSTKNLELEKQNAELRLAYNKLTFTNFYTKYVEVKQVLTNKEIGFKDDLEEDIFNTQMFEKWSKMNEEEKAQLIYTMDLRTPIIKNTDFAKKEEINMIATNDKDDEKKRYAKLQQLAKNDGTILSSTNYSYYLDKFVRNN